jgi:Mitochondrial carrier protein
VGIPAKETAVCQGRTGMDIRGRSIGEYNLHSFPVREFSMAFYIVEYSVHHHVGDLETRRTCGDIPLPGGTIKNTSMSVHCTFNARTLLIYTQNNATAHLYPNIRTCIRRMWATEGAVGFYRGLGTNLVRVLPGTCVTFVVYENLAWLLRTSAAKREERKKGHREK